MQLPARRRRTWSRGVYAGYADRVSPGGHRGRQADRLPFDPKKLEAHRRADRAARGLSVRNNGFNIDLTIATNGTLAYTTGGTQASPPRRVGDPRGAGDAGGFRLGPAGHHRVGGAVARRQGDRRGALATAGATSGSSGCPPGPSRGSPSATRRAAGPPGRPTDGTSTTSPTARARRRPGLRPPVRRDRLAAPVVSAPWTSARCRRRGTDGGSCSGRRPRRPPHPTFSGSAWATRCRCRWSPPGERALPGALTRRPVAGVRSDESGTFEIYVRPFPETAGAKWQVSTAGGSQPVWSSTGRELIYVNGKNEMVSAQIPPGATSPSARSGRCSRSSRSPGGAVPGFWLSPDDKRFLVLREGEAGSRASWWWRRRVEQLAGAGAR